MSSKNKRPKIVEQKITESDSGTAVRKVDSPIQEQTGDIKKKSS